MAIPMQVSHSLWEREKGRVLEWGRIVFLFFVPISPYVSVRLLVLLLAFSLLFNFRWNKLVSGGWDRALYFAVLGIGVLFSLNKSAGLSLLETSFSLIAVPFVFREMNGVNDNTLHKAFPPFCAGLIAAGVVCLGASMMGYTQTGELEEFFYYRLTSVIDSHPTYLAYFLIASVTYCLYVLFYGQLRVPKALLVIVILFFFLLLLLTGGNTAYTSLLLIFSFFILKFLLETRNLNRTATFVMCCVMLVGMFGFKSLEYFDVSIDGDYWERSLLWQSAIRANPHPLFGVGTGDYREVLNEYFAAHGMVEYAEESYNAHNQYIQSYFSSGLVGIIALLLMLAKPLYVSVRRQHTIGILLCFPFLIYGVTEVFLGRYQGVVFFAFMHELSSGIAATTTERTLWQAKPADEGFNVPKIKS